jgi:prolipoprotein diacylglyceryltransferase
LAGLCWLRGWRAGLLPRRAIDADHVWNILAWALIVGILRTRLYHVFSTPANGVGFNYYMQNPQEIFNFWNGGFRGLGIYGG